MIPRIGSGLKDAPARYIAVGLLFALAFEVNAQPTLIIDDRVSKFEAFYAHASTDPRTSDARFALWQKEDGLAAVPPGPSGDAMAHKLLDAAWPRYAALIPRLPALRQHASRLAHDLFSRDSELLDAGNDNITARLVLYVGQYDNNAYTVPAMDGKPPTVLMPVENIILKLALAHELTHAIHLQLAGIQNSFGAPVGETMLMEGLAMRTAQRVVPGLPDAEYTEMPGVTGWFATCAAHNMQSLNGLLPTLIEVGVRSPSNTHSARAIRAYHAKLIARAGSWSAI